MFVCPSFDRISLTCLSLFVLCPIVSLYNLRAIYFFWVICYIMAATIDQLVCLISFSPGSDHGSLFSLVRGWSEIWVVWFLPVLWLCVASSLELGLHHSSFVPPMAHAEVFFGPSLPEANPLFFSTCWICWFCTVLHLCCFHTFLDALSRRYFFSVYYLLSDTVCLFRILLW